MILWKTALRSPFDGPGVLYVPAFVLYLLLGLGVLFVSLAFDLGSEERVAEMACAAQTVCVVSVVLLSLTVVVAFMNHAQGVYAGAVFKLYFEDVAERAGFDLSSTFDTADGVKNIERRFAASLPMAYLFFVLSIPACALSYAVLFFYNRKITVLMLNAVITLPIFFCASGYWVVFSLASIHVRSPSLLDFQFLDNIVIYLIMSSLMLLLLLTFSVLFCLHTHCGFPTVCDDIYTITFFIFFVIIAVVTVAFFILSLAYSLHISRTFLHPCLEKTEYFIKCSSPYQTSSSSASSPSRLLDFNLSAGTENDNSSHSYLFNLTALSWPILLLHTISSFFALSPKEKDAAYSIFTSSNSTSSSINISSLSSISLSSTGITPTDSISREDCRKMGRSVLLYNDVVDVVGVNDTECLDMTDMVVEWLEDVQKGTYALKVSSAWLNAFWLLCEMVVLIMLIFVKIFH